MVISVHVEKAFDKIHHPFAIKILRNPGVQGNIHSLIKNIYEKPPELYSCLSVPQDFQHFCFALFRFPVWLLSFVYRTVSEFSTNLVMENHIKHWAQVFSSPFHLILDTSNLSFLSQPCDTAKALLFSLPLSIIPLPGLIAQILRLLPHAQNW